MTLLTGNSVQQVTPTVAPVAPPTANQSDKQAIPSTAYAGNEACRPCHAAKVNSYLTTAHYKTSSLATKDTVGGSFDAGHNVLVTANPRLSFRMESKPDGLYQSALTAAAPGAQPDVVRTERMDVVTGSGRKGQTYLYWKGDQLFELPVSYWTQQHAWVNSPGFRDGELNFSRIITPRCIECHGTSITVKPGTANNYDRAGFIAGIGCEKCHGPAKDHVARMKTKERPPIAKDVVNTAKLTRERQIDLCGTCHSGGIMGSAPAFSYVPGAALRDYFIAAPTPGSLLPRPSSPLLPPQGPPAVPVSAEVHGNQVGLMQSSKCYLNSATMTCSTCHNVHEPQRDVAAFAGKCLTCHTVQACRLFPRAGQKIANRCIDCHMPNQTSGVISVTASAASMSPRVRNHAIRIYPVVSDEVMKTLAQ